MKESAWLAPTAGGVGALASWRAPGGGARLASSGTDGTIQMRAATAGLGLDPPEWARAVAGLRRLLRDHDGRAVADLAARLM